MLAGIDAADFWAYGGLPASLPPGDYHIDADLDRETATRAALGWALGTYAFTRYKSGNGKTFATLAWPERADRAEVERIATATYLVRDLINTPASDMGPEELAQAAETLGDEFNAKVKVIVGDDLLKKNYPAIHAVGRASTRAPRLIDLTWGDKDAPGVTLVGKGVCFDTGGLDLKPSSGMLLMKKDMGGAAHVLGVARMIMMAELPVRLRVLIPAVENSVSGDAFRPLDAGDPQGADRRGWQYRRRGPPGPVRRAGQSGERQARGDHRLRHPDRRRLSRAGHGASGAVQQRRCPG